MNTNTPCPVATGLDVCSLADLVPDSGVAALVDGDQVALFYLPCAKPAVFALGNYDPIGGANVMSRGIVGDLNGELVVASQLYKQHFSLRTGQCIEQPEHQLPTWEVTIDNGRVRLAR